ncbi:CinA family protein [Nocardioides sp. SYSU D00038]|uniref:CinA family protein n=1 Tax=Nocardioides sp. SYSU D00038 TaxID=2812554 RepID=UPI0019671ADC|nr:CinA family protein [Nocardioides sp. SYSU D00038]
MVDPAAPQAGLPNALVAALRGRGETLATAESLTGGRLAALVTGVPGASEAYVGGVVSYATEVKIEVLGVPRALVQRHGVVSAECAVAMARGAVSTLGATWALSTTGVAGPEPQEDRSVGTVFVGVAGPGVAEARALRLAGDRWTIQDRACREALSALGGILGLEESGLG